MENRAAMPNEVPAITQLIAEFVYATEWVDLPEEVRHQTKRALVNYFAVALAGCRDPDIETAVKLLSALNPGGQGGLVGRSESVGMLDAAALNAMSANVYDFDDTHIPTIIHPTGPVASALFALAGQTTISGEQLLLSLALGMEIECRLGNALHPWHYQRGWHITSTCGVFGAAVGVGKAIGLDAHQLGWAIGNASAQASGLVETLGSAAKSLSVGNAPKNGLLSALLAQKGFAGPAYPLEGERGFLKVMGDSPRFEELLRGLGSSWEVLDNTYKPYPCGVVLNPVIEACIALHAERGWSYQQVGRVELIGNPLLRERTDRAHIKLGRESQVSAQHAVAVTLATGKAGLDQFSDAAVADPALREKYPLIHFSDDPACSVESVTVRVILDTGKCLEHRIASAKGGLKAPLSDAELVEKLTTLATRSGSAIDIKALVESIWSLDMIDDAGMVMALATDR